MAYGIRLFYDDNSGGGWSSADTAAVAQVASTALNVVSAANTNKKQRKWMEQQYDKQRADALADYHMQNDYNSPAAAMKRYKEAGLNPNLIYGNAGNSPSVNIRSSDTGSWHPEAPQVDLRGAASSLLESQSLRNQAVQNDLLKEQVEVAKQTKILQAAQTQKVVADTTSTGVRTAADQLALDQARQNFDTSLQTSQARLDQIRANTTFTLDQNERAAATNAQSIQTGLENILNLRASRKQTDAQTDNLRQQLANGKLDGTLKQLDINLKKMGIQPGDPMWSRVVGQLLQDPKGVAERINQALTGKTAAEREAHKRDLEKAFGGPLPSM